MCLWISDIFVNTGIWCIIIFGWSSWWRWCNPCLNRWLIMLPYFCSYSLSRKSKLNCQKIHLRSESNYWCIFFFFFFYFSFPLSLSLYFFYFKLWWRERCNGWFWRCWPQQRCKRPYGDILDWWDWHIFNFPQGAIDTEFSEVC